MPPRGRRDAESVVYGSVKKKKKKRGDSRVFMGATIFQAGIKRRTRTVSRNVAGIRVHRDVSVLVRQINLGNGQCQYCFDHFTSWIRQIHVIWKLASVTKRWDGK